MIMTSEPPALTADERSDRGLLCARCEHLNHLGHRTCESCGAELFVACPRCGQENQRVMARCHHCRKRLHRGWLRRRRHRPHRRRRVLRRIGLVILQVTLVLLGLGLIFGILYLANYLLF